MQLNVISHAYMNDIFLDEKLVFVIVRAIGWSLGYPHSLHEQESVIHFK